MTLVPADLRRADGSLADRLLGWRPRVSCQDGLLRTISWFEESFAAA
ncbi:hypothetical protein [Actinomadura alba]|uniref:NAD-dependent dehydratase n=1 Tax=Actinomadura alba TaxID=406431 RepID=A0ABR7LNJ4_9ACTN|nr:hypothetical protein [Actinomadura alba]MBC6466412.1 hypothetical protein [Actinomadura alba]